MDARRSYLGNWTKTVPRFLEERRTTKVARLWSRANIPWSVSLWKLTQEIGNLRRGTGPKARESLYALAKRSDPNQMVL